jgi:hypothetical protein
VHRLADLGDGPTGGLHAWQLLMTSTGCFTGLTSAQVRGWWLPPVPDGMPVFMAMGLDDPRPMRRGVLTSRHTREIAFDEIDGVRCASVPETLLACGRRLCVIDVVVMVDCVLHLELATREEIKAVLGPRRPGSRVLQQALELADERSESVYETLLRLLHVWCEIVVVPQFELVDEDGLLVAKTDLWIWGNEGHPRVRRRRAREGAAADQGPPT